MALGVVAMNASIRPNEYIPEWFSLDGSAAANSYKLYLDFIRAHGQPTGELSIVSTDSATMMRTRHPGEVSE